MKTTTDPDEARFARLDQILMAENDALDAVLGDLEIGIERRPSSEGVAHWSVTVDGDPVGVVVPFGVSVLRSPWKAEPKENGGRS